MRVNITTDINPPLPPDIIFDRGYAKNIFKGNLEYHQNSRGLRIPVFLLEISHPVFLRRLCDLISQKMKMVGVAAVTSINNALTMWPNAMEMKIQKFSGLETQRNL